MHPLPLRPISRFNRTLTSRGTPPPNRLVYFQRAQALSLILLTMVLFLTSCGGGSTSPSRPTPPAPSPSDTSSATDPGVALAGAAVETLAVASGSTTGNPTTLESMDEIGNPLAALGNSIGILAVTTTVIYCGADPAVDTGDGSRTTVVDDKDPAGPSTGDTVTVTFTQCVRGTRTIDGTRTHTINTLTGTPFVTAPWSVETAGTRDITITSASGSKLTTQGSGTTNHASTDGVVITHAAKGQSKSSRTNATGTTTTSDETVEFARTVDSNTQTATTTAKINISGTSGTFSLNTSTPISGPLNAPPTAGVIVIEKVDAAGAKSITTLTVQSDGTVLVEVDSNGDGTIDSSVTVPWTGLLRLTGGPLFGGGLASSGNASPAGPPSNIGSRRGP